MLTLLRFPSFSLGSDRTTNRVAIYFPVSLFPAVSVASSLALYSACSEDDYLSFSNDGPSPSWLYGYCFTSSEATIVSP